MTDRGPLRIAAIYFLFGFTWILVSDTLVIWIATSSEQVARLQTAKGWVYVLLTTVLVYVLLHIYSGRKDSAHQETIRAGELLSEALEQKQLLVRELHHRVKNNLQTVLAFLNLADETEPPGSVHRRVHSMADTHEIAMAFPDPTEIDLMTFVQRVVSATTRTPGRHVTVATADADSPAYPEPRFGLTVNQAVPLGMSLHEILRSYEPQEDQPSTISVTVEVAINETEWRVAVRGEARRNPGLSATARALCGAWATQLGGGIEYTDASAILTVARRNKLSRVPETEGE